MWNRTHDWFFIGSALLGSLFLVQSLDAAQDPLRCPDCNVILISIDTLRADHLGVYGYEKNTSPNIDRLGAEAFVFEQAFSQTSSRL